jgi:hypothetical protein
MGISASSLLFASAIAKEQPPSEAPPPIFETAVETRSVGIEESGASSAPCKAALQNDGSADTIPRKQDDGQAEEEREQEGEEEEEEKQEEEEEQEEKGVTSSMPKSSFRDFFMWVNGPEGVPAPHFDDPFYSESARWYEAWRNGSVYEVPEQVRQWAALRLRPLPISAFSLLL